MQTSLRFVWIVLQKLKYSIAVIFTLFISDVIVNHFLQLPWPRDVLEGSAYLAFTTVISFVCIVIICIVGALVLDVTRSLISNSYNIWMQAERETLPKEVKDENILLRAAGPEAKNSEQRNMLLRTIQKVTRKV